MKQGELGYMLFVVLASVARQVLFILALVWLDAKPEKPTVDQHILRDSGVDSDMVEEEDEEEEEGYSGLRYARWYVGAAHLANIGTPGYEAFHCRSRRQSPLTQNCKFSSSRYRKWQRCCRKVFRDESA